MMLSDYGIKTKTCAKQTLIRIAEQAKIRNERGKEINQLKLVLKDVYAVIYILYKLPQTMITGPEQSPAIPPGTDPELEVH
jgi:hypothetical protein